MKKVITFTEYLLNESDGGGGVAFATANGGGMGNIVAPTVGAVPGSVSQNGSGTIGSGDVSDNAFKMGKKFRLTVDKDRKPKKKVKGKKGNNKLPRYFTNEYMTL
jgi:outer membrane lipoprotein SlyB